MPPPCIGFEIGLGHICWYFRAYICSKILKVLHPCIGFGIGLGHIWGHANAWIWYIHAYAWILYIHVLSHISHIPKAEIFGFMFQYLSSERMGLRFWANPIHNTWLDHGEISRTRCTPNRPAVHRTHCFTEMLIVHPEQLNSKTYFILTWIIVDICIGLCPDIWKGGLERAKEAKAVLEMIPTKRPTHLHLPSNYFPQKVKIFVLGNN